MLQILFDRITLGFRYRYLLKILNAMRGAGGGGGGDSGFQVTGMIEVLWGV